MICRCQHYNNTLVPARQRARFRRGEVAGPAMTTAPRLSAEPIELLVSGPGGARSVNILLICAMFPQGHDVSGHISELVVSKQWIRHASFPRHLGQRGNRAAQ